MILILLRFLKILLDLQMKLNQLKNFEIENTYQNNFRPYMRIYQMKFNLIGHKVLMKKIVNHLNEELLNNLPMNKKKYKK